MRDTVPSRNSASAAPSSSRNSRAKWWKFTGASLMAKKTVSASTPTPLRRLRLSLKRSKRGWSAPSITSMGPLCVANAAADSSAANSSLSLTWTRAPSLQNTPLGTMPKLPGPGLSWIGARMRPSSM